VLFRPEEVHAASSLTPGYFSCDRFGEGDIHVSHDHRWLDFEDLLAPHADEDGVPTIQATRVYPDLGIAKEPAHGQRV
jgi:hypothetical protein